MKPLRPPVLLFLVAMLPSVVFAQGVILSGPQTATNPYEYRLRCQAPNPSANPYKQKFGCKDVHFDTKETLSRNWTGARSALRDEGITPTASHVAALQTNPGGHAAQEWNNDDELSFSLNFNLHKILSVPGLSFYISAFENSGGNLSGIIYSTVPVNTLFVGPFHLGEMYLPEPFEDGRLLFAAGRLGPNFQLAAIPVIENYLGGFNAQVSNIGVNDPAFFRPPPSVEWGSQIVYRINTPLEVLVSLGAIQTRRDAIAIIVGILLVTAMGEPVRRLRLKVTAPNISQNGREEPSSTKTGSRRFGER